MRRLTKLLTEQVKELYYPPLAGCRFRSRSGGCGMVAFAWLAGIPRWNCLVGPYMARVRW
jgi:hypothetical protein